MMDMIRSAPVVRTEERFVDILIVVVIIAIFFGVSMLRSRIRNRRER